MKKTEDTLFAVTAPGLEGLCAGELQALGLEGIAPTPGGVEFRGGLRELYLANLWLRTASRVVVRLGSVRSRDFPDYYRKLVRLPWGRFLRPEATVQVRATSHGSRLNHSGRIAETVEAAINRALGREASPAIDPALAPQLVLARFEDDLCQLSIDSSGALLHRRGYREESAMAPLRETLAAAVLLQLGWNGAEPLVDPMCGSGTFAIEAALLARNLPPGRERSFAFMAWPRYRPGLWQALLLEAGRQSRPLAVTIVGADRDPRALAAARRNAERAGVAENLRLECLELARLQAPAASGLMLANPPYGTRLEAGSDLAPLFRQFGQAWRGSFAGWRSALLCPPDAPLAASGHALRPLAQWHNGGLPVTLFYLDPKK
jgi:putative N6-adenine-specific DNA methylase